MRKRITRIAAIAMALMVLFSALFSVPVWASGPDDDDSSWWDDFYDNVVDTLGFLESGTWQSLGFSEFLSNGGTYGLINSRPYYTGSSVPVFDIPDPGGVGDSGSRGTVTGNQSGQTVSTPIVSSTYNTTNNSYNYHLNIPTTNYNYTTNNYYEQYDITNIYHNQQYNTYNFEVTNNFTDIYNYYVTYAPTFVNITYLDSANGKVNSNVYFFQLPDGRSS